MAFKPSTEAQAALDAFTAANPPVYMTVGDDPTMVGPSSEASPVYSQYAQLSAAADYERRSNDWGQLVDTYPGLGQLQTAISQYGVDTAGGMWSSGQIHIPEGAQAAASELLQHAQASNSHGTFQQTFGITPEEGVEAAMVAMGAGIASGAGVGEAVAGGGSTAAASTAGEATAATTTTTAAAGETAAATSAAAETVPQVVVTAAAPATDAGAGAAATAAAGTAASAGGTTMPAAVPPSAVDVSNSGLTQTGPGQWEDLSKFGTPAASSVPTLGSIATHLATNVALGLVYNALFGKHGEDSGSLDSLARGALVNAVSNIEPIPVVYGSRRKAGAIVLLEVSGTANEYLNVVVVWCEGPISAINTLYLNDVDATDSRFSGLVDRYDHLGSDTQTADAVLVAEIANAAKWSTTSTLSGLAYTYLRLKWNATAFSGGLPNITADIDGRTLYDPRTATTAFSHNPALAIRDYLTNTRYGRGVDSATMIDDVAFTGAARTCDDLVTVPNGSGGTTTQARYRCDGIVDVDQKPIDNLKALLTACRGFLVFSGGQYKLKIDRLEPITVSQGYESSAWVAGSAAPTGYSLNQDIAGESTFAARTGPYGTSEVVNVCQSLDTPAGDPGPDGGWTMSASIAIDKTKPYLFACFFKRLSTGLDLGSSAYWGLHTNSASDTLNLDGTPNTNPYFLADAIASFMPSADQWYLAVGFVHENGYGTSSASISGIYDLNGNKVVAGGTEFKWPADATAVGHRAYHYYNQRISGEIQQMTRPVVIQCDAASAAATIAALLAGPTAGAFTLSEDNIVGGWSVQLGSKRTRYNRVKARFFNPAAAWQPDIAIQDSSAFRVLDNALVLEASQLDLPFTTDAYRAGQIAQIEMKRSRFGIVVTLTATIAAMALEVGDVVPVTHGTFGWSAKRFRVLEVELLATDEVRLTLLEYDDSVYTLDALTAVVSAPTVNLPNPRTAAAPGAPSITEALYQTTGSAGVKSRATVSWQASADIYVQQGGYYQLERSPTGTGTWTVFSRVQSSGTGTVSYSIDDMKPAVYDWRVRAFNSLDVASAYSPTTTQEIVGLTAPPSDLGNFLVQNYAGMAKFTWSKPSSNSDLDVVIGGRIYVRWSPKTSGADWGNGTLINPDGFPGDTSLGFGPLLQGTYMAKACDSSGNYSVNEATFVVTEALLTGITTLATVTESPTFTGTKSNTVFTDGVLKLDSASTIDSMLTLMDSWGSFDVIGGVSGTGSYSFAGKLDLGSKQAARLFSSIDSLAFDADDLIDSRTNNIDDWGMLDGADIEDAEVQLMVRTTDDDPNGGSPTWSAWQALGHVADYNYRGFDFRLDFASGSATHNRQVSALSVTAKH